MLVLVPRAAAAAGRLYHEHALHALVGAVPEWHAGANDVVQDAADAGMGHGVADDRAVDMRLAQVHVAADEPFVILRPVDRLDLVAPGHPLDGRARVAAPIDPPQLTRNLGAGGPVHQAGDQHVPALDVGSPQFVARGLRRIELRDCHRLAAIGKGSRRRRSRQQIDNKQRRSALRVQYPHHDPSAATVWLTRSTSAPPLAPAEAYANPSQLPLTPSLVFYQGAERLRSGSRRCALRKQRES